MRWQEHEAKKQREIVHVRKWWLCMGRGGAPVAGIDRHCTWCPEVHVTQAKHHVGRLENDAPNLLYASLHITRRARFACGIQPSWHRLKKIKLSCLFA